MLITRQEKLVLFHRVPRPYKHFYRIVVGTVHALMTFIFIKVYNVSGCAELCVLKERENIITKYILNHGFKLCVIFRMCFIIIVETF